MPKRDSPSETSVRNRQKSFGNEFARIRSRKGRTRVQVAWKVNEHLEREGENKGEVWVGRVENGLVVKLPRKVVEALCKAVDCTEGERIRLLVCADLNVLGDHADDPAAVVLNRFIGELYEEVYDILHKPLAQRKIDDLNGREIRELVFTALDLIRRHRT